MQTLTLGDLRFVAEPSGVVVELDGAARQFALSSHEAGQLEEFLRRNLPRERRTGFRVRIAPLAEGLRSSFHVFVGPAQHRHEVHPVDLSLTGILVEGTDLGLAQGRTITVMLELDGQRCSLTGEVVRMDGDLAALHFVESLKGGELAPPEALLGIYRRLETAWLRSRID
jgi:hypothetical protein